jgi:hypothetical protein
MEIDKYRVSNLSVTDIQKIIKKNGTTTTLIYTTLRDEEVRIFSHISSCRISNSILIFESNGKGLCFKHTRETLQKCFISSSEEAKDILAEIFKKNEREYVSDEEIKAYPRYNLLLTFKFSKYKYKKDEVDGWSLSECFAHFDDGFWDMFVRDDTKVQDDRYYYRFFSPMDKTIKGKEISYIKPNVFHYFIELCYYLANCFEEFTANCQRDYENDTFSHIFTQFGKFRIDGKELYSALMPSFRCLNDLFRYICIEYFYCGERVIREDDYCEIYFFGDYQWYKKPLNGCVIIKGGKCEYKELERI